LRSEWPGLPVTIRPPFGSCANAVTACSISPPSRTSTGLCPSATSGLRAGHSAAHSGRLRSQRLHEPNYHDKTGLGGSAQSPSVDGENAVVGVPAGPSQADCRKRSLNGELPSHVVANFAAVWRSIHSEGDERVLGKLFAVSSVTCISSCWIFRADSRDSLASFRQASHIVEIVPTVEIKKVPPEINTAGLSHESSWGPARETEGSILKLRSPKRRTPDIAAKITPGKAAKAASTQIAILPHRMSVLRFVAILRLGARLRKILVCEPFQPRLAAGQLWA
jgi:hypothetical protein